MALSALDPTVFYWFRNQMEVDKDLDQKQFHPLEDTWTLWFQKQNESGSTSATAWLEGLKEVMSFGTVCIVVSNFTLVLTI